MVAVRYSCSGIVKCGGADVTSTGAPSLAISVKHLDVGEAFLNAAKVTTDARRVHTMYLVRDIKLIIRLSGEHLPYRTPYAVLKSAGQIGANGFIPSQTLKTWCVGVEPFFFSPPFRVYVGPPSTKHRILRL